VATSHDTGVHKTGSARSEGYYKIDPMAKKAYIRHSLPSFATPTPKSETTKKEVCDTVLLCVVLSDFRIDYLPSRGSVSWQMSSYNSSFLVLL